MPLCPTPASRVPFWIVWIVCAWILSRGSILNWFKCWISLLGKVQPTSFERTTIHFKHWLIITLNFRYVQLIWTTVFHCFNICNKTCVCLSDPPWSIGYSWQRLANVCGEKERTLLKLKVSATLCLVLLLHLKAGRTRQTIISYSRRPSTTWLWAESWQCRRPRSSWCPRPSGAAASATARPPCCTSSRRSAGSSCCPPEIELVPR